MRLLPRATVLMGVPTFYTRLLGSSAFGPKHVQQAAPRHLGLGAAAGRDAPRLHASAPASSILERYGMTETGMITSNPYDGRPACRARSATRCPRCACASPTPRAAACAAGDVGVLEVKGPNVFKGYWRNPEKTREEFRKDGYFITGDLATKDADGRVTIVGRAKDLIITGGFNVYPKEIESELNELPGVDESAVVGVPHPDFGESIVAVITALPGKKPPGEAEILKVLAKRLAKFKLPKRVFLAKELPRNSMGKVQKVELAKQYADLFKG